MIAASSLLCLALVGFRETRGEPESSQRAAMLVTENRRHEMERRVEHPVSVCKVVSKRRQYAWVSKYGLAIPKTEQKEWLQSVAIAKSVLAGEVKDLTKGAMFFNTRKLGKRFKTRIKPIVIAAMMYY